MTPDVFRHALILTGPTGSGKSRLALELAPRLNAEIVCMDSMTLYRGLDVGTAKPTPEERARVRHHLLDVLEPHESASVAWWLDQAAVVVNEIESRGKVALFVGGTPLYLKALLHGLFDGPPADAELRARLEEEARQQGQQALHDRLAAVDPAGAKKIHPNDLRRVVRALEVYELTGRPMSQWQTQWKKPLTPRPPLPQRGEGEPDTGGSAADSSFLLPPLPSVGEGGGGGEGDEDRCLCIDLPRDELYRRIDARVLDMIEHGLVEEVRKLRQLDKALSREAAQALGYKELFAHLDGAVSLDEAVREIQTRSRNFAKRQLTWFRHLTGCKLVSAPLTRQLWSHRMNKCA
jgi:tRNA dimethylallyltransferase